MTKQRIGYIGVGLMGHGAARNILQKGYPLTIMGHRNRAPVDDLVALGAQEAATPAEVAGTSDVVFLCLPSTVEVEHTIYGADGVLAGAARGLIVVDSTTADPRSTQRIGADLATRGIRMVDAPLGRTPKEAEAGKLSTFVGGDPATVRAVTTDHRVLRRHDHRSRRAGCGPYAEARQQLHRDRHQRRHRRSAGDGGQARRRSAQALRRRLRRWRQQQDVPDDDAVGAGR